MNNKDRETKNPNDNKSTFLALFITVLLMSVFVFSAYRDSGDVDHNFVLTIGHINDTHSHLEPITESLHFDGNRTYVEIGGYPGLVNQANRLRAFRENLLMLHAGNVFHGTIYYHEYRGMAELEFLELMGLDAMALGNHEFDDGPETLSNFTEKANFPILCANIDVSADHFLDGQVEPYVIKEFGDEKVGIIGLITPETPVISSPGPGISFSDPRIAAESAVAELESQGIDKIIALTHLGYENDMELAGEVSGIDIIVGGHSRTLLGNFCPLGLESQGDYPTLVRNQDGEDVLVVQAWEWGKVMGILEVEFDGNGRIVSHSGDPLMVSGDSFQRQDAEGIRIPVDNETKEAIESSIDKIPVISIVPGDSEATELLGEYSGTIETLYQDVIASVSEDLYNVRIPGNTNSAGEVMENGSRIAPVVADGMRWKTQVVGLDADIAMMNVGGCRADILQGNLTLGDIYTLQPFGNELVVLDLTGSEVESALEHGVSKAVFDDEFRGAFPYVSGLRYTADVREETGDHIVTVHVLDANESWTPLDMNGTYRVVVNAFMARGGDGYTVLADAAGYRYGTGFVDAEVFLEYAEHLGTISGQDESNVELIR